MAPFTGPPTPPHAPGCPLPQYMSAGLLLHALRRTRVAPTLRVPSASELRALLDTFGVLTLFYAAKNLSYVMIQVGCCQRANTVPRGAVERASGG